MTHTLAATPCVLTADQGNTALKLSVWDAQADPSDPLCVPADHAVFGPDDAEDIFAWVERKAPCAAIYCSVRGIDPRMVESLRQLSDDNLTVLTHSTPLPVGIRYATPATLGMDRVALAAGAAALYGAQRCMVADAGTALTLDLVADGTFGGGRIAPGMRLRFEALNRYTSRLPLVSPTPGGVPVCGDDTHTSIASGVLRGMAAEIAGAMASYSAAHGLLTGGDAGLLMPLLPEGCGVEHAPHLMSRGLLAVLRHNDLCSTEDFSDTDFTS